MQTTIRPLGDLSPLKNPKDSDRYCGKRCGRGCTHGEYESRIEQAQELAKSLPGDWSAEIWENLGWHYKAMYKRNDENYLAIYSESNGRYWGDSRIAGRQFHVYGATPQETLKELLHEIDAVTATERAHFRVFRDTCGNKPIAEGEKSA